MKIALIEDNPAEMERAQRAVVEASLAIHTDIEWESFRMDMVPLEFVFQRLEAMGGTLSGVITDLHFNPRVEWSPKNSPDDAATARSLASNPPPAGLAVVIWCVARGVPVVICTDSYHHGAGVTWFNDVGLPKGRGEGDIRLSLTDVVRNGRKDWDEAINSLFYLTGEIKK